LEPSPPVVEAAAPEPLPAVDSGQAEPQALEAVLPVAAQVDAGAVAQAVAPVAEAPQPQAMEAPAATQLPAAEPPAKALAAAAAAGPPPAPRPLHPVIAPVLPQPEPASVLLPATAVQTSLWDAAGMVARAAATPDLAYSDAAPVFAQRSPGAFETAPVSSSPAVVPIVAPVPGPVAPPPVVPVIQPGSVAPVATPSPYDAAGFLAAARAKSDSIQWAVLGGTAAFLGVVWVTIWLVTGK
jgi:nicotinate-nucleotide--dimethylbenzimidazole phosphoribosyltransferase